jgi:hypothetical protein
MPSRFSDPFHNICKHRLGSSAMFESMFGWRFIDWADSEDAESLRYLKSVRNLHAMLTQLILLGLVEDADADEV